MTVSIGVVLLTGVGPAEDGGYAFCSLVVIRACAAMGAMSDEEGMPRLNVLDLQRLIRSLPKVVIGLGGGVCHWWRPGVAPALRPQPGGRECCASGRPVRKVGSFDGGFGAGYLARLVGQRKAREIWFLCRQLRRR